MTVTAEARRTGFPGQFANGVLAATCGRAARHTLLFVALVGVWEAVTAAGLIDRLILPRPSDILVSLFNMTVVQGNVWPHFAITLFEAVVGFLVGAAIGIALAIAAGLNETFRRYISPYIVALQVTPRIALAPIVIAWLGFGVLPKIGIAAMVCFFAPFINTLTGLLNVDEDAHEMFRSLGARKSQIFWSLMLPSAVPIIMAGLKTSISLALIGAIVGEFITASAGLGIMMQRYTFALNMPSSFAVLLMLTVMGYILFLLMEFLDNTIVFWRHDARLSAVSRRRARKWPLPAS